MASDLHADCASCFGLCCVAPAFAASADFAIDKPADQPCPNLRDDFRCGIHDRLRPEGFPGCAVFTCFGAGQKVAQTTFGGQDWREAPHTAKPMFDVFAVMRQLHEWLWYLAEARTLPAARPLHAELVAASTEIEALTLRPPEALLALDLASHRTRIGALLLRASELVRSGLPGAHVDRLGADLLGADLHGTDLRGASLRGTLLVGADLRGADLGGADLLGADLRGADIGEADLRGSIFLTQSQLEAARGDARTRLPASVTRPAHWPQR
ncbi:MAG: hypothetical protein DLM59_17625 [Pseudonocardiales bacterium]|nr:MAG: hypothetical protein DLM59_17625 [Pseudonocardiales bacterium]